LQDLQKLLFFRLMKDQWVAWQAQIDLSLGQLIWPSGSLISTVWPWCLEIFGAPT